MPRVVAAIAGIGAGGRPVVLDIGSGGGWAARHFGAADVIAIDILNAAAGSAALHVRADMRSLPLHDHTVDAVLYIASLHYAPIEDSVREASRVLRPGGMLVALDSPMYRDRPASAQALARSAAYYGRAGFPELAEHYHPIDLARLLAALAGRDFEVVRLDAGTSGRGWLVLPGRRRRPSFLLARSNPS